MATTWGTPVGWTGTRDEIAAMYGGTKYQGMETPSSSPNILLFTDPKVGRENGYEFDGWSTDGEVFSYTGMDRVGPQRMHKGNLGLLTHKEAGKAVRLFGVSGKAAVGNGLTRIYLGEFAIDDEHPYSVEDAPGADDVMRTVFVFHMRPVGEILRRDEDLSSKAVAPTDAGRAEPVSLEQHAVAEFERAAVEAGTGVKREQDLVSAFQAVLEGRGRELNRFKVYPKGSTMPLFTDIHDATEGILYEAKADATRNSVRGGLGQLLDYRRYVDGRPCRLLLPAAPNGDLLELLAEHDVAVVWRVRETSSFEIHEGGVTRAF